MLRIRLHSSAGHYPTANVWSEGSQLLHAPGLVVSAVRLADPEVHGIDGIQVYSELEFLALEEIRFFSCVALSLRPDRGMIHAYPLPIHTDVFCDDATTDSIFDHAVSLATAQSQLSYRSAQQALLPINGGPDYRHHDEPLDQSMLRALLRGTDLRDHLLIRGLGALLKADMLWCHREFADAAAIVTHIALDASFQIVLRRLKAMGIQNPSAMDAGKFLDDAFDYQGETRPYFEQYYADRIKAAHPASRFGVFPFAPLSADDFYDLRSNLHAVFAYIIAGRIWPDLRR